MARKKKQEDFKTVENIEIEQEVQEVQVPTEVKGPSISSYSNKEFLRLFGVYRRNVVEPETYAFFDDVLGNTYNNDRYDPQENQAAYEVAKQNADRIQIDLGSLSVGTGAGINPITPHGPWEITLNDDGYAVVYSPDANTLGPGMFTVDLIIKAENKNIEVQNFSGCDNCTFAGGIGKFFGNPVRDNLDGTKWIRVPFYFNGTDCTTGPGSVLEDKFKIKFKNGEKDDLVTIQKVVVYRYDKK